MYLKTDKFEVKLEGISFKLRDFEPLCTMDFLFPKGKVWPNPPVVGIDVLRHPRDATIGLLLLCFGIGCVILRFHLGEDLPDAIIKFLQDDRIYFAGFGIPEKKDLFPFDSLGFKESKVDVGYMAAKRLNDPKLKKYELADLARRVLGVKAMVGVTEARSLGRHEQIKCAICEVFVSSVIAMTLLNPKNEKKIANAAKKGFFGNLELPSLSVEGWSKIPTRKKKNNDVHVQTSSNETSGDDSGDATDCSTKRPLKGILKCSSSGSTFAQICSSPHNPEGERGSHLKRANSKGYNVSFVEKNSVRVT